MKKLNYIIKYVVSNNEKLLLVFQIKLENVSVSDQNNFQTAARTLKHDIFGSFNIFKKYCILLFIYPLFIVLYP